MTQASSVPPDNPYVGPRPFELGQRLYGRDREIHELCDLLIYKRFVLLYSPSGAGKTSLIQAGLVPTLQAKRYPVLLPPIRVNKEPPQGFAPAALAYNRYLLSTYMSFEDTFPETLRTPLADLALIRSLPEYMALRAEKLAQAEQKDARKVELLIFDQFEEVVSLDYTDRDAKRNFFLELSALLHEYRHLALFAMREDYVGGMEEYLALLPEQMAARFRIDLLGYQAAKAAIQQPSQERKVTFTEPAAEKLLEELRQTIVQQSDDTIATVAGPYVEPMQLQVVCQRLWELRDEPDTISEADLHALSSADQPTAALPVEADAPRSTVDVAIASFYEQTVETLANPPDVTVRAIRDWFDQQLITSRGLRGQVLKSPQSSQGLANNVIEALVNAHLVRREDRRGLTWYELAHDRLVRPIKANNQAWYKRNLMPFQKKASTWLSEGRPPAQLLTGRELSEARAWKGDLTPGEHEFVQASVEALRAFERERRAERGTNLEDMGWGVIFATDADPRLREALSELLEHRRYQATERRREFYKEFSGTRGYQRGETTRQFLARYNVGHGLANPDKMPRYLLIVGGPELIPFEFQYGLDEFYAVGRIAFDTLEEYASYARSVVLAESGSFTLPRSMAVFNPVPPYDVASRLANEKLVNPLVNQLREVYPDWKIRFLQHQDATKDNLKELCGGSETPALLFASAHCALFPLGHEHQLIDSGALVCQDWPGATQAIAREHYVAATDISTEARLIGLVAFVFGEFSAGTPEAQEVAFVSSLNSKRHQLAPRPFLSPLAQRLLGHPQGGAMGLIGHVDTVWGHSFMDEENNTDIVAIVDTVDRLMRGHTLGSALEALNQRYLNLYYLLADEMQAVMFHAKPRDDRALQTMLRQAIDARNYILIGDPAARLPIDVTASDTSTVVAERPIIEPVPAFDDVQSAAPAPAQVAPPPAQPPSVTPPMPPSTRGLPVGGTLDMVPSAPLQPDTDQLVFNGLVADSGAYLLRLSREELAQLIVEEPVAREQERELRWYLESRSRSAF